MALQQDRSSPAWRIIEYLQRHSSATVKELEQVLGITTTAVRQHLQTLQAEGYVDRRPVHSGVGRPHYVYVATEAARRLFACHCDDLAVTLLEEMLAQEGPQKVAHLLQRVSTRLADRYAPEVTATDLRRRVEQMAQALGAQGVLAEVQQKEGETIVLRTYNCPYYDLAQEHREICAMDQAMMQQVLGSDVSLQACMLDGNGGCAFVIAPNEAETS